MRIEIQSTFLFKKERSLKYGNIFTATIIIRQGFIPLGCVRRFILYLETMTIRLLTKHAIPISSIKFCEFFIMLLFHLEDPNTEHVKTLPRIFFSSIIFDEDKKQRTRNMAFLSSTKW